MEIGTENTAANVDAVNVAASEGVADPENTEVNQPTETPTEEVTPTEPAPPVTETQAFARRLAEKTGEVEQALWAKVNPIIAKLGGSLPDGSPVQTFEDLQKALEYQEMQAEAAKQNVPVEVLSRLSQAEKDALEAKDMLSAYQRKETIAKEAEALATDPRWGEFYKANETDIRAVAERVGCDLGTAKLIVYDRVGPQKVDAEAIASKAIQEFIEGKRASYKPVEGGGATPTQVVQTPKTFAEAREGAKAILRSMNEQT